jgi:SnoaL-like domain
MVHYLTAADARRFAEGWLPAWSGNDPERLASFYSDDAVYLDPGIPGGVKGKSELLGYFRNLLAYNPNWVWSQIEAIAMEDGFLNKWRAVIPVGTTQLEIVGVCLVQLDEAGKIRRNEVYFDRSELLTVISLQRAAVSPSMALRAARAALR